MTSSGMLTAVHYGSCVTMITLPILASALGQARIARAALHALDLQPQADGALKKLLFATLALAETVVLISVFLAYYFYQEPVTTPAHACMRIGLTLALVIPGVIIGYGSSLGGAQNFLSLARQPLLAGKVMTFMFITQSLLQTPLFCNAIFAVFIHNQLPTNPTLYNGIHLGAAGLLLGLGALGPCLGLSYFIGQASAALGIQRSAYGAVFSSTFISQSLIETPFLLALSLSIFMLQTPVLTLVHAVACVAAALAVGFANFGPCVSSAWACSRVLPGLGLHPENGPLVSRYTLFTQAFIDTTAIYGLLLGGWLILP